MKTPETTTLDEIKKLCSQASAILDQIKTKIALAETTASPAVTYEQQDLPGLEITCTRTRRTRHGIGNRGFEDKPNPACVRAGQINGLKNQGRPHTPSPRRPHGTVNVKSMTLQEKRRYWRWADARRNCRRENTTPPSWNEWSAKN